MPRREILFSLLLAVVGLLAIVRLVTQREASPSPESPAAEGAVEVVLRDLTVPWALAWLPDGTLLVTERTGQVVLLREEARTTIAIADVAAVGEGGLLGVAVHPQFAANSWVYLYRTTERTGSLTNEVLRYRFDGTTFTDEHSVLSGLPASRVHNGGRIAFGPDGMLYVATGDAGNEASAQDTASLAGKILRVRDDGAIPADNPSGTAVYSSGHRNVQGLAWDAAGQLWATEHGRSGLRSGLDEVNRVTAGNNYGWPTVEGDATSPEFTAPVVHSGPDVTWAPAGAAVVGDTLFFAGLRGQSLYALPLRADGTVGTVTAHFAATYGRLRAVALGPDGLLYLTTSNTDGRGAAQAGDDKVIRLSPAALP